MTSTTPTGNQDDSRREVIVSAAAEVFAERGFSGTSNREIARVAGISPGLIYWYFEDKNDLFRAVIARLFPLYGLTIPEEVDDLPLNRLLFGVGSQFMSIVTSPDIIRLMRLALSELIAFPEIWQQVGEMIASQAIGPLSRQLDIRMERGEIPQTNSWLAAQAYFGSLVGYVLRKYLYQSSDLMNTDDEEMVRTVVQIYSAGLSRRLTPDEQGGEIQ
jgi:AcrR family transcriptional regulator